MTSTIVYLHGFNSSPDSVKGRQLGRAIAALPDAAQPGYLLPRLHHRPAEAIRALIELLDAHRGDSIVLVGSSLGGFYATHLAERFGVKAVLINPAIRPYRDLASHLGPQTNKHTGEAYELTTEHFAELEALAVPRITRPARYFLLVEGDELLDAREAIAYYAGAWQFVRSGGSHGFADFEAQIPAVLRFASGNCAAQQASPVIRG